MNKLTITRQNGNVPKSLAGYDHVSGMLFYVPASGDIPAGFASQPIQAVSTIDRAEALGIESDSASWAIRLMHYQLDTIFNLNSGITLYVGIFAKPETHTFAEITQMQNYADGAIRQIAIWDGTTAVTAENVALLHSKANALDLENAPLSVLYAPLVSNCQSLPTNLAGSAPRVSVVIGQPGSGTGAELYADEANAVNKYTVSAIGIALGHLSSATVQQSISWVKAFPAGVSLAAFGDGTLIREVDKALIESLDTARYLFLMPIVGVTGNYWNDSHNMDSATSDYCSIELVRTMDKAVRGIRTYIAPELGGNVYIDATTGKLQPYSCSYLETVAGKALEDMEKAGELSGYEVKVDPEQDVLSNSTIEFVIKNVSVGVVRRMNVKIGYVKSLE